MITIKKIIVLPLILTVPCQHHSHKKRTELAVLRTYVENQAILETILLYQASKCKQTKGQGSEDCLFLPYYKIIVSFFFFLMSRCKQNKIKLAIIGYNLSKKHKLTLYKTQNGESNYVDLRFFFNFYQELPTCTKPWGKTSKCYRGGQLVGACIV